MKLFRAIPLLAFAGAACEHSKPPAPADTSAAKVGGVAVITAGSPAANWDASAGPLLLVAGDNPTTALVVVPDAANITSTLAALPHPASVTLFSRTGTVQSADLPAPADSGVCSNATLSAAPPPRPWSVGFIGGVESPVSVDSVESLSRADSAALVVWTNRLASALPNDSAGRFTGLPFVVHSIWRFTAPGGPQTFVSTVTRQINQEATPLQEHTLLVAERPASDTTFSTVYSERSYGDEETIESRDLLAVIQLGPNKNAAIVLTRDYGNATAYGLVERGDDGRWRLRWTSARRHCGS